MQCIFTSLGNKACCGLSQASTFNSLAHSQIRALNLVGHQTTICSDLVHASMSLMEIKHLVAYHRLAHLTQTESLIHSSENIGTLYAIKFRGISGINLKGADTL